MADQPLYRPKGCGHCDRTGYAGRIALTELMPVTGQMRQLIAQRATPEALKQGAAAEGMRTLWQDGLRKAAQGLTTLDLVKRVALTGE